VRIAGACALTKEKPSQIMVDASDIASKSKDRARTSTTSDESLQSQKITLQLRPTISSTRKRWHRTSMIFFAFKKLKSPATTENDAALPASTEVLAAAVKGTSGLAPLADLARSDNHRPFILRAFSARHVEMRSGANAFDFESPAADPKAQPYWQQGDAKWDEPELVQQRARLLQSRKFARAARQFWDACGLDEGATMSKAEYATVHRLVTCALAPDMTEAQSAAALEDDWLDDLRGAAEMSFERYLLSLYEIADLWTDSASELAYVVFINKLYRRITKPMRPDQLQLTAGRTARGGAAGAAFRAAATLRKFKRPEEVKPMHPEDEDDDEEGEAGAEEEEEEEQVEGPAREHAGGEALALLRGPRRRPRPCSSTGTGGLSIPGPRDLAAAPGPPQTSPSPPACPRPRR